MSPFGNSPFANPNNGIVLPQPPDDTISRLRFSPPSAGPTYITASSWNGSVRVWQVDQSGQCAAVAITESSAPVLDAAWAASGDAIYAASVDKLVTRWDLASNTRTTVAAHDAAVRHCFEVPTINALATASWDRTLKYWDVRQPTGQPVGSVPLSERVYAMDVRGPLMVLGLAERKLAIFDVRKPSTPHHEKYSQLRYQTRCIATWPNSMGYAVGSVEGKVSVDFVQEPKPGANYAFLCHRSGGVHAINAIRFHNPSGAFVTAGSDGGIAFWDKDRKDRAQMRQFTNMDAPICDVDFSDDGTFFACAVGYDWSRGAAGHGGEPCYVVMHTIEDGELHRAKGGGGGGGRGRGRGRRRGGRR